MDATTAGYGNSRRRWRNVGMEIVDIEFRHEGSRGGRVLRVYLDKEGGPKWMSSVGSART